MQVKCKRGATSQTAVGLGRDGQANRGGTRVLAASRQGKKSKEVKLSEMGPRALREVETKGVAKKAVLEL